MDCLDGTASRMPFRSPDWSQIGLEQMAFSRVLSLKATFSCSDMMHQLLLCCLISGNLQREPNVHSSQRHGNRGQKRRGVSEVILWMWSRRVSEMRGVLDDVEDNLVKEELSYFERWW